MSAHSTLPSPASLETVGLKEWVPTHCRQVLQGRVAETCDEVLAAIKLKLKIRTKIGLYELIETFKHFAEDGKEGITYPQMRMVFEMMGFTFSDNQVLALFAQFDNELRGEARAQPVHTVVHTCITLGEKGHR